MKKICDVIIVEKRVKSGQNKILRTFLNNIYYVYRLTKQEYRAQIINAVLTVCMQKILS